MLGWVILVTTLVFLLYVTTMSLKLRNILTKSNFRNDIFHGGLGHFLLNSMEKFHAIP